MKLLIAGSRRINDFNLSKCIPDGVDLIISGGAKGIDTLAEQYADENGIQKLIIRPNYEKYGRVAPIKRNEEMIELCDTVLAVWDGKSKGTAYTLNYSRKKGRKIIEIIDCSEK